MSWDSQPGLFNSRIWDLTESGLSLEAYGTVRLSQIGMSTHDQAPTGSLYRNVDRKIKTILLPTLDGFQ